jgi:hypothetical protein
VEERDAKIVRLYGEGASYSFIAARALCSQSTVWRVLRLHGLGRGRGANNRKLSETDRDEIVRLYLTPVDGAWLGVKAIAERFGVRHFTVQRVLRIRGIASRSCAAAANPGKARGERGIYEYVGRFMPAERRAARRTQRPECRCGCGRIVAWDHGRNRWRRYADRECYDTFRALEAERLQQLDPSRRRRRSRWRRIREFVIARDGGACRRCGLMEAEFHVHHLRPWAWAQPWRFIPENLVLLCKDCHRWVHSSANVEREFLIDDDALPAAA